MTAVISLTESASPVSASEVARVRQPVADAHMLPPRVFHDPAVFAFEQERWFGRTWVCVGRESDIPSGGNYIVVDVAGESVIVIRDRADELHAFHNVCRHRGSTLLDATGEECGRAVRIQCPYHAWIYELDGSLKRAPHTEDINDFALSEQGLVTVRLETWAGFLFVNLDAQAQPLLAYLDDLPAAVAQYPIAGLERARRIEYEVGANWKVIGENYSECLHCPGVHPQLNKLSPYDRGWNLESRGPWAGGWMELVDFAETMSNDDGSAHGRPHLAGIGEENGRRVYYIVVWPNMLLSLHPDYVMTHQVWPIDAERSHVICEWLFDPAVMAEPGFDATDAVDFWDLTNRQDWAVCERQQAGTRSRSYVPGRYSLMEDMVHAFDLMAADRYADDGVQTRFAPRHDKWAPEPRRRAG